MDLNNLKGPDRAAIVLLSMNPDQVAKVFSYMDHDEIKELSHAMATLGSVPAPMVENLFMDFVSQISETGTVVGTFESTEKLLLKALDKSQVDVIMEEIRGPAGRTMWDKLGNVNESVLASYLKNEYPQTVAVILLKIGSQHAAGVLAQLPESFAMDVISRMLKMEPVQKEVLDDVERTLRTEFMSNLAKTSKRDAYEQMAEIFNFFDRNTETRFLTALEEQQKESADKIRSLMFTFEDLSRLDAKSIQALLRVADKDKLAKALKGASDTLKDLFFTNMSERAAKILKEDMEAMGPVRVKEVDEAQSSLVMAAKDLSDKGEIVLSDNRKEDEFVT